MASDKAVRGQCRTSPSARADGLTSRISEERLAINETINF